MVLAVTIFVCLVLVGFNAFYTTDELQEKTRESSRNIKK